MNQPSGRLAYIAEERAKLYALSPADQSADAGYRSSIAQQAAQLAHLDSLVQAGAGINQAQYEALVQQKAAVESAYSAFLQAKASARQQQAQNLLALNNNVVTNAHFPVANHKAVNNVLLGMIANNADAPTEPELALLAAIASQCPIEGGDAVYEARSFVERFTGETFDDAAICAVGQERPSNGRDSDVQINREDVVVYPNPSTGQIFWSGLAGKPLRVRVLNPLGQLVAERDTTGNSLDLGILPEGVYQVQFSCPDTKLLLNRSLVIQKR
jgi:hypothetical protein